VSSALTENRLLFAKMASGLILDCGCGRGLYRDVLGVREKLLVPTLKKNI